MKYLINKEQYEKLVEIKKQKRIAEQILKDINKVKHTINESVLLEEGIVDVLKTYLKKGLLTTAVLSTLLANNVSAQQLAKAGVSDNKINIAQELSKEISPQKIERALLKALRDNNQKGTIEQYKSLDQQTKTNILNAVANKVKGDLSKIKNYDLSLYLNKSKELKGDQYTKVSERKTIDVDTTYTNVDRNYNTDFEFNSAKLKNPEGTKQMFQEYMNAFNKIEKITIIASSSALRNKGDFEGMTWLESSQMRVNTLKNILIGMEYDLGGCGLNKKHAITQDIIFQNIKGTNGDGTSGPPSPYELNKDNIEWYRQQGIDEKLWNSNGSGEPYEDINEYKKHQYVIVRISGEAVETDTTEIVNIHYLKMKVKKDGGRVTNPNPGEKQRVKVLACPKH